MTYNEGLEKKLGKERAITEEESDDDVNVMGFILLYKYPIFSQCPH